MIAIAFDEGLRSITLIADATVGIFTGPPGMVGSTAPNTGKQFCFVKIVAGVSTVGLAVDGDCDGVLQNKPQHPGDAATMGIAGVSVVQAGATVAAGAKVKPNGSGLAVTASGADVVVGKALTAGAVGELISVLLKMN